jgi:hypothetical protein
MFALFDFFPLLSSLMWQHQNGFNLGSSSRDYGVVKEGKINFECLNLRGLIMLKTALKICVAYMLLPSVVLCLLPTTPTSTCDT